MPARNVKAAADSAKAMQLRILGYTYEQIARECNYASRGAAHTAIHRELKRTLPPLAEDVRLLEDQRLDALLRTMMPQALKGSLGAVDRVLRIMERRAKLLGLEVVHHAVDGEVSLTVRYVDDWRGDGGDEQPVIAEAGSGLLADLLLEEGANGHSNGYNGNGA